MKRVLSVLLAAVTAAACISVLPSSAADVNAEFPIASVKTDTDPLLASYAEEVAYLVNQQRIANGLGELKMVPALNSAAQKRADEIVETFDHNRPDGTKCFTVLAEYGLTYSYAGENIAYGYIDPDDVMDGWMNSEGHRKNILNSNYQYIGVGVTRSGNRLYWTQMFIKSSSVSDAFTPTKPIKWGDANGDGKVSTADSVAILQHIGNRDKYGLTKEGMENADVDGIAGITPNDALVIQQVDAGIYSLSDLPLVRV